MANRIDKINSLIKEQLAEILITHIDREHFKLVTITKVITSKDLSSAKVFISLPNNTFESFESWSRGHIYQLQKELNSRLSLHHIPKIRFMEDTTSAYVNRMEELFRKIRPSKSGEGD